MNSKRMLGEILDFGKYFDDKVQGFSGHSFIDHIGDSELKNYIDYTEAPAQMMSPQWAAHVR